MFMRATGSTVPRRQLGRFLQQLRSEGNLTVQRVSSELTWSVQKLWRIESGLVDVKVPDVKALCEVYRAAPVITGLLVDLARQGSPAGWWQPDDDGVPDWFEPYLVLEASADRLRHYDGELVHSLLQTVPYMADVLGRGRSELGSELDEERWRCRIELRRQRQRLLDRQGPAASRLEFIVSEAVLRRPIASRRAWAEQLRHLAQVNERPNMSVRVLPLAVGPHAASVAGAFAVLDFPRPRRQEGEPPVVYQEGLTGGLYLDRPADVSFFEGVWESLDKLALCAGDSTDLFQTLAGEHQ